MIDFILAAAIILLLLILILGPFTYDYFRIKLRDKAMKKLAEEFQLSYEKKFSSFDPFKYWFSPTTLLNTVQGNIGNHTVELSDFHQNLWIPVVTKKMSRNHTSVIIDGKK